MMKIFYEKVGLLSVWDKFPIDYTYIHTDLKSTSTLDHFLVNERLLDLVVDAGVLHFGDNLSRHSPIIMKLNVGRLLVKRVGLTIKQKKHPECLILSIISIRGPHIEQEMHLGASY